MAGVQEKEAISWQTETQTVYPRHSPNYCDNIPNYCGTPGAIAKWLHYENTISRFIWPTLRLRRVTMNRLSINCFDMNLPQSYGFKPRTVSLTDRFTDDGIFSRRAERNH